MLLRAMIRDTIYDAAAYARVAADYAMMLRALLLMMPLLPCADALIKSR